MEYVLNGYTGNITEGRLIIHSPDGHVMFCRRMEIENKEELKGFMMGFLL